MDTILGESKKFLLVQKNKEDGVELTLNYSEYNGMFIPNYNISMATRWDDIKMVGQLASTQNMISQLLKQKYEYYVVEENIIREKYVESK